jgi:hypothetical protein
MTGFADSSTAPRSIEAVARRAQIWSDNFFRKSEITGTHGRIEMPFFSTAGGRKS